MPPWKTPLDCDSKKNKPVLLIVQGKKRKETTYVFESWDNFSQTRGTEVEQDPLPLEELKRAWKSLLTREH